MAGKGVDNKRIAKNAMMLAIRSILVALVGLYTSRVVLSTLGIDDFGIYGVIGGIIGMVSFLNTSMSGATSRFITFELGKDNSEELKNVFSTSLRIHLFIALGVILLGETVGLWFLNNRMNIPADRMTAANILYQFTVLSVLISFTQVPYNATIIAHEKMNIYAYFEILFTVLKLAIVYILLITPTGRLVLYGALTFILTLFNALIYRWYCIKHFEETRNFRVYNKSLAKKMLFFSGYDLYGNMGVVAQRQGQPIVLNLFYGVVANAAATLGMNVINAIANLTMTIFQAFRPQIVKQYAAGNIQIMSSLMSRSVKFNLLAYAAIAIPVMLETPNILYLWLDQIPQYAVVFIRIILVVQLFDIAILCNNAAIHATGNISRLSFINGSMYLLCPVFSYIWLKHGGEAKDIYIINVIMFGIILVIGTILVGKQVSLKLALRQIVSVLRSYIAVIIACLAVFFVRRSLYGDAPWANELSYFSNFIEILVVVLICLPILLILYASICLNKEERSFLIRGMLKFFIKFKIKRARG